MKALYPWIVLLVLIALVAGYYLIPTNLEVALYRLKGNDYKEAESFYEKEYANRIRTPDVVYQLSKIYENEGNLTAAISIMKEYVAMHPDDFEAIRRLGDLYERNQQYDEYFQILVTLKRMQPKSSNAKEKADLLIELESLEQEKNDTDQLINTLKELIGTSQADEGYYLELAHLYAKKNEYEEGRRILEMRRELFAKKVTLNDIIFEAFLTLKVSSAEGGNAKLETSAVELVADLLLKKKEPDQVYYAIGYFEENYPKLAPALINKLALLINKNPNLETAVLQYMLENPNEKMKAYERIIQLSKNLPNNPDIQNMAFNAILDEDDEALLIDFIHKTQSENIEERGIYNLSMSALIHNNPLLAKEMQKKLGRDYLDKHPLSALFLATGAQEKRAREKLDQFLGRYHPIPLDNYYLFNLAAAAKFNEEALQIGSELPPFIGMTDDQILEITEVYIQLKKADLIRTMIENSLSKIGKKNAIPALLMLEISSLETENAIRWIKHQDQVKQNILNAFFLAAKESGAYSFALDIAKMRLHNYPSEANEADYGFALVHTGNAKEGIEILKKLYGKHPSDTIEDDYFSSLVFAYKKDPRYKEDLAAFMDTREQKGPLTKDLQSSFAYIYLEVMRDFTKAKKHFEILAEGASPKSDEVQTLIYLWGPSVSEREANWIRSRAQNSDLENLPLWLNNLNYIGDTCTAISIFHERRMEVLDIDTWFAYMDALAYEEQWEDLRDALDQTFSYVEERKSLERLSAYAEEALYPEIRKCIWDKITIDFPNDPTAWQNYAKAAFDMHDYAATLTAIQNYFSLVTCSSNPKLYELFYELGESFWKGRCFETACGYFTLGMQEIADANEQTPYMLELDALMHYRLNEFTHEGALELMDQSFALSGRDSEIGASYVNMMMDEGYLESAVNFFESFLEKNYESRVCNED